MTWFRENPFFAGLTLVTVIAVGAVVFLVTQAMAQYGEVSENYTQAVGKLHALQNRSPYPSTENLEKTKVLAAQYTTELSTLREQLTTLEAPLDLEIGPQQFQDDLRVAVNEANEKASKAGVVLPADFYLGFNQYENSPPDAKAAPYLARQLIVIRELVGNLIDVKVESIDRLVRQPLTQELPAGKQPEKPGIVERYEIDLAFTADQSKFRVIFNSLLKSNRFLIVRGLNITNTSTDGPPVVAASDPNPASTIPGLNPNQATPTDASNELNVILGREQVKVALRLEMIDFTPTPTEARK